MEKWYCHDIIINTGLQKMPLTKMLPVKRRIILNDIKYVTDDYFKGTSKIKISLSEKTYSIYLAKYYWGSYLGSNKSRYIKSLKSLILPSSKVKIFSLKVDSSVV